jgi:zona occludens toxin (predicted ATPase)
MSIGWLNNLMVCYIERKYSKDLIFKKLKSHLKKKDRQMQSTRSLSRNLEVYIFLISLVFIFFIQIYHY